MEIFLASFRVLTDCSACSNMVTAPSWAHSLIMSGEQITVDYASDDEERKGRGLYLNPLSDWRKEVNEKRAHCVTTSAKALKVRVLVVE